MQAFGITIARTKTIKAHVDLQTKTILSMAGIDSTRGWWPFGGFTETEPGGWQRNETVSLSTALRHPTVFACVSLIQKDCGKMRLRLMERQSSGILVEIENSAYSPVLRKPNHFQTRQRFVETWINSKLLHGNAIILKQRDERFVVKAQYVLDPTKVQVLVAPDGSLFYQLQTDDIAGIHQPVTVPAREITHDMMPALFHPLIGVSPLYAAGAVAEQGLTIQDQSSNFFANGARPSGVLTAAGRIDQARADAVKNYWNSAFTGTNAGKVAFIGDGLTYTPMPMASASDSQLVEQSEWLDERICSCFGMPPHKVGVGDQPHYSNVEAFNQQYWSECLQYYAEGVEIGLTEGLGTRPYEVRFDLGDLWRMDTETKTKVASEGIRAGFVSPNEARRMFDLPPVEGGDTPYMQHQDYALSALNQRDRQQPAPGSLTAPPSPSEPVKHVLEISTKALPPSEPVSAAVDWAECRRRYQKALAA